MKNYSSSYQTQYIHIHSPCRYTSYHGDNNLHVKHSSQCTGVDAAGATISSVTAHNAQGWMQLVLPSALSQLTMHRGGCSWCYHQLCHSSQCTGVDAAGATISSVTAHNAQGWMQLVLPSALSQLTMHRGGCSWCYHQLCHSSQCTGVDAAGATISSVTAHNAQGWMQLVLPSALSQLTMHRGGCSWCYHQLCHSSQCTGVDAAGATISSVTAHNAQGWMQLVLPSALSQLTMHRGGCSWCYHQLCHSSQCTGVDAAGATISSVTAHNAQGWMQLVLPSALSQLTMHRGGCSWCYHQLCHSSQCTGVDAAGATISSVTAHNAQGWMQLVLPSALSQLTMHRAVIRRKIVIA